MEYLDNMLFDNTLRRWLLALVMGGCFMGVLCLWRTIIGKRFSALAAQTATKIDDLLAELITNTKSFFFLFFSIYFGSLFLTLPEIPRVILGRIAVLVVVLQIALWSGRTINFILNRYLKKRTASDASAASTVGLISFFARCIVWAIVFLLILDNLGMDITAMVAGMGIGGIAIALALQNILGDLFASLSIILDKPFVIGDFIIVGDYLGTVEHIGIKTTRLRSLSGEQLVFSNNDLLNSRIRNYKRMWERRVVFKFGVVYQTPVEKLPVISGKVKEIIEGTERTRFDRCHFFKFGDSSLDFECVYYVLGPDYNTYMDIQQEINLAIMRWFEQENVEFAYPTQTLFIEKD